MTKPEEIQNDAAALVQALQANNDAMAAAAGLRLLVAALTDLNRIANAIEILATAPAAPGA